LTRDESRKHSEEVAKNVINDKSVKNSRDITDSSTTKKGGKRTQE